MSASTALLSFFCSVYQPAVLYYYDSALSVIDVGQLLASLYVVPLIVSCQRDWRGKREGVRRHHAVTVGEAWYHIDSAESDRDKN